MSLLQGNAAGKSHLKNFKWKPPFFTTHSYICYIFPERYSKVTFLLRTFLVMRLESYGRVRAKENEAMRSTRPTSFFLSHSTVTFKPYNWKSS